MKTLDSSMEKLSDYQVIYKKSLYLGQIPDFQRCSLPCIRSQIFMTSSLN